MSGRAVGTSATKEWSPPWNERYEQAPGGPGSAVTLLHLIADDTWGNVGTGHA